MSAKIWLIHPQAPSVSDTKTPAGTALDKSEIQTQGEGKLSMNNTRSMHTFWAQKITLGVATGLHVLL